MELLKYQRLTGLLDSLTDGADILRAVFEKHPTIILEPVVEYKEGKPARIGHFRKRRIPTKEAREHPDFQHRRLMLNDADQVVTESARLMDKCGDEIESDSKARHDQGMTATDEIRVLYDSMTRFLDATDTPIDGVGTLYNKTRNRCRALVNKLATWFPDLNPDQVPPAIPGDVPPGMSDREMMVELFRTKLSSTQEYKNATYNGHIINLWTWNDSISELVDWLTANDLINKDHNGRYMWRYADGAFLDTKGDPITKDRLTEANKNINRKIKL